LRRMFGPNQTHAVSLDILNSVISLGPFWLNEKLYICIYIKISFLVSRAEDGEWILVY
jgi:hypothetical protein